MLKSFAHSALLSHNKEAEVDHLTLPVYIERAEACSRGRDLASWERNEFKDSYSLRFAVRLQSGWRLSR